MNRSRTFFSPNISRVALAALAAALVSCFGAREAATAKFYTPAAPRLAGSPGRVLTQPLVVTDFRVASHLAGDRMAARVSPQEVEYYSQHRWAGSLDRLLTEESRVVLRNYFASVSAEASGAENEWLLSASVEAFEEEDEGERWFARAAIDITLRDGFTGETIWKGLLESRKPAVVRHPAAVAQALGEALGEILGQAAASWGKILSDPSGDR